MGPGRAAWQCTAPRTQRKESNAMGAQRSARSGRVVYSLKPVPRAAAAPFPWLPSARLPARLPACLPACQVAHKKEIPFRPFCHRRRRVALPGLLASPCTACARAKQGDAFPAKVAGIYFAAESRRKGKGAAAFRIDARKKQSATQRGNDEETESNLYSTAGPSRPALLPAGTRRSDIRRPSTAAAWRGAVLRGAATCAICRGWVGFRTSEHTATC